MPTPDEVSGRAASLGVRRSVAERYVRWTLAPMLGGVLFALGTLAVSRAQWHVFVPSSIWLLTIALAAVFARQKRWLRAAAWLCVGLLAVTTSAVVMGGVRTLAYVANTVLLALVVPLYGPRWGWAALGWTLLVAGGWLVAHELGEVPEYPMSTLTQSYVFGSLILVLMLPVLIAPTRMLNQALVESQQRLAELRRAREQESAAARALRDTERQLAQAKRLEALGRLSAGIAHDFNNMLSAVRGATDLVAASIDEGDDVAAREHLKLLDEASERATTLTRQLLAFGRRGRFESRQVDIVGVVRNVCALSRSTLGPGIALMVDVPEGALWVSGDRVALEQALLNLVLNARDALGGHGRVVVQVRRTQVESEWCEASSFDFAPGDAVQITVQDDGPGIPEEVRQQLFEPFFTTKPEGVGTGLGLAAVHGTVVSHRGMIESQDRIRQRYGISHLSAVDCGA